jgi:hypothetical protein
VNNHSQQPRKSTDNSLFLQIRTRAMAQAKAEARLVGPGQWHPGQPSRPAAERNKSGPVGRACAKFPNGALEGILF